MVKVKAAASEEFPGPAFGGDPILLALMREAIQNELSPPQRRALEAVWYEHKKIREAAQAESVSESGIRKRLSISYGKLKEALRYAVRYAQLLKLEEDYAEVEEYEYKHKYYNEI
ncbi:MAG: hypothetical protein LBQ80_03335 [Clostridium sp.]|nr:hypothetical protein [Clostridium sp.]